MTGSQTSKQLADLQEKRTDLLRLIQKWHEAQTVYMPHVASMLSGAADDVSHISEDIHTEEIPLFLPSSLPLNIRSLPEMKNVCDLEQRLREPQADDAIDNVRKQRRIIQGLWKFKRLNVSGTGNKPNARMITLYKRFNKKTQRAADTYCQARKALMVLNPTGEWLSRLKDLKDQNISGPGQDPDDKSSKSRYKPSWIWLVASTSDIETEGQDLPEDNEANTPEPDDGNDSNDGDDDNEENEATEGTADSTRSPRHSRFSKKEFNDSMHVEWAKARARMRRWDEQLLLVQEEMRRVIAYHEWKAGWWEERAELRDDVDINVSRGIAGYAHKQAAICRKMAQCCAIYWVKHLREVSIYPSWGVGYTVSTDTQLSEDEGEEVIIPRLD